jgi:tRNA (guanine37-N1)-methyltransferase
MERQWYVAAPRTHAEAIRQTLLRSGLLDPSHKVRQEGDFVRFPIVSWCEGAEEGEFEPLPGHPVLPRHELIGGIAVMQEADREAAALLLGSRPSLHTVLYPESDVEGEYRTRRFTVLAGLDTTRTQVLEYHHRFTIDLSLAYFSARLAQERQRIQHLVTPGELVLDMFAGVGPYAITLASRSRLVVAADINPGALLLLEENLTRNHVTNVLAILTDATRLPAILPWRFDRVIMNLPLGGDRFLGAAFRLCRPGGMIHFYALQEAEGAHLPDIRQYPVIGVTERKVRTYSPGRWHAVYDIRVGEEENDQTG